MDRKSFHLEGCGRTHHAPKHSAPGTRFGNCHARFISSGHGWYYDGQRRIDLNAGQALLLTGDDQGHVVCDPHNPYDFIFMNFTGPEALRLNQQIIERHGQLFEIHNKIQIMQLCRRIYHLPNKNNTFALADALLAELLVLLLDREEHSDNQLHFNRITEYLENRLHMSIAREQVAAHFSVHPLTVDRICKSACGQTMRQVHEEMRMRLAISLLGDQQMNIANVAAHIGFDDQFHFSRVFKKHMSLSPKQYQSRLAGKSQ